MIDDMPVTRGAKRAADCSSKKKTIAIAPQEHPKPMTLLRQLQCHADSSVTVKQNQVALNLISSFLENCQWDSEVLPLIKAMNHYLSTNKKQANKPLIAEEEQAAMTWLTDTCARIRNQGKSVENLPMVDLLPVSLMCRVIAVDHSGKFHNVSVQKLRPLLQAELQKLSEEATYKPVEDHTNPIPPRYVEDPVPKATRIRNLITHRCRD
jgi:hypothetical protein